MTELRKGMRVRAEWLDAAPLGSFSLAGVQPKVSATAHTVEGVVTHIRGDHPTDPTSVGVWIQPDDGDEVTVPLGAIVAVLGEPA